MAGKNTTLGFKTAMPQLYVALGISILFVMTGIVFSLFVFGDTPKPVDEYMEAAEWNNKIMRMFIYSGIISIISNVLSTVCAHKGKYKQKIWWTFMIINFLLGIAMLAACSILYAEGTWCHIFAYVFFVLEPVVTYFFASIPIPKFYRGGGYPPFF
ncbi:MAG: hypothetical protein IJ583_16245 [Firmicutes bacterium]|nr:hypothetical protein [Bacillota bacterium]